MIMAPATGSATVKESLWISSHSYPWLVSFIFYIFIFLVSCDCDSPQKENYRQEDINNLAIVLLLIKN